MSKFCVARSKNAARPMKLLWAYGVQWLCREANNQNFTVREPASLARGIVGRRAPRKEDNGSDSGDVTGVVIRSTVQQTVA
jgi:hypothetical protein